ncbi:MAG: hypothetical protein HZB46_09525 [Solirubrobacterales bacterium]|nr:hypothetical protein [Solirubrobacterales bacterium]
MSSPDTLHTNGAVGVLCLGGAGRSAMNDAEYRLRRGFHDTSVFVATVDLIPHDPHAVAPDGTDVTDNPDTTLTLLRAEHARAALTDIAEGRTVPTALRGWVTPEHARALLPKIPAEAEGSAQEPVITAVAADADLLAIRSRVQTLVARVREHSAGGAPTFFVAFGAGAGGVGPGAVVVCTKQLKEAAGPQASVSLIGLLPESWMRLKAHNSLEVQDHMMAKTAATLRTLRDALGDEVDVTWLVGSHPNALAAASPLTGSCMVAGTLIAATALDPGRIATVRPNWKQNVTHQRPFSTLGASVVTLAAADQARRLAHDHARQGWQEVLTLDADRAAAASQEADGLLDDFAPSPEILSIALADRGVVVAQAEVAGHDALLRTGATDDRDTPQPPAELHDPRCLGVVARADDVRALCARIIDEDRDQVDRHLELNREQGVDAISAQAGRHIARVIPAEGTVIAQDPPRLVATSATLAAAEARCRDAAARLRADVAAVDEELRPVQRAMEALQACLEGLRDRVTFRAVAHCLTATEAVVEAHRWRAATAATAMLFDAYADRIGRYGRTLDGALDVVRQSERHEARRHAAVVDELRALANVANVTLAFLPGSGAEASFDREAEEHLRGGHRTPALRALGDFSLLTKGDLSTPDGWQLLLRHPAKSGTVAARLEAADEAVPIDVLSAALHGGSGSRPGTATCCARVTVADALGHAAVAEATAEGTTLTTSGVDGFVDALLERLNRTTPPSAALRPKHDGRQLPSPDPLVLLDARAPETDAGQAVARSLAAKMSALHLQLAGARAQQAAGTLVVLTNHHGLELEHLELAKVSIPKYVESDKPVDTTTAGAAAHQIEHEAWRQGRFPEPRLLDPSVVAILDDPELLAAAGVVTAFDRLPEVAGERASDPDRVVLKDGNERVLMTLAPVGSPAHAIAALCTRARHLRTYILQLADDTIRTVKHDNGGDRLIAAAEVVRRISALQLSRETTPVHGADLALALEMLLTPPPADPLTITAKPFPGHPAGPTDDRVLPRSGEAAA